MYAYRTTTWYSVPLYNLILEILASKGGIVKDREIYEAVREKIPVSYTDFLKALMDLEIRGLIRVQLLTEDLRTVELVV